MHRENLETWKVKPGDEHHLSSRLSLELIVDCRTFHWLGGVFVLPEHRGQGIASLLVTRMIGEARELGLTELYLWTPSSESLYARHGWKVFERASYHGAQICIMHRHLPS